jgi:peroxiredoxin Q/BCP
VDHFRREILKLRQFVTVALLVVAGGVWSAHSATAEDLAAGDMAPPFTLRASDGTTYSLDQFRGERAVVLAWFPKAFTGG